MATKYQKMARFVPGLFRPDTNRNVRGLLSAWGAEDDLAVKAIQDAKEQIFVKTARTNFLDALGSNVGVFRPTAIGLADEQYRQLIPALSFYPKQVVPTIKRVLEIFFEDNYQVFQINPNEIVIQIPNSVPALRRTLKGSHHFHAANGTITAIDTTFKTVTVDLKHASKVLVEDEWAQADLGVGNRAKRILSNTPGNTGVVLQFELSTNLSDISVGQKFNVGRAFNADGVSPYAGGFIPDTRRAFTVTSKRGILNQNIVAGQIYASISLEDASQIPDGEGRLVFGSGKMNEEANVRYFGRPNNTTILIDPSYTFLKAHSIGESVNVTVKPYKKPRTNGADYSAYIVGVEAARFLAQQIVESIVAAGVVVRWIVKEPKC